MEDSILKYALWNAVKFKGKANPGGVLGRIMGEFPDARENKEETMKLVQAIVEKVNSMSPEEQKQLLKETDEELYKDVSGEKKKEDKEKKKEKKENSNNKEEGRKELAPLQNAEEGKVVTRLPPAPSKYNHVGHAMSFLINYMYAKKYKGKCILRFEDANPTDTKQEYVDAMYEDVCQYLDIKPDKVVFISDQMEKYYEAALDLIKRGEAYVCTCEREIMQDNRMKGIECEHRNTNPEHNEKEWNKMFNGDYHDGEAILRIKMDMQSKNSVLRDPVLFRIIDHPHFRHGDKYRVWPNYDFYVSLNDAWLEVTHVMRSNEFALREPLQNHIRELFGYRNPTIKEYGRAVVRGATTKGREIRELMEKGEMIGWHDPRLVTLRALEHRGIKKETFYDLATEIGTSKKETPIDWTLISSINRKYLDEECNRYFFVESPVKITVENAPPQNIELSLHPHKRKGGRLFETNDVFYISKSDIDSMEDGEVFRLMDCINVKIENKNDLKFSYHSKDFNQFKEVKGKKIIHFLPADESNESKLEKVQILMPDASIIDGLAEPLVKDLEMQTIVQFERFGFCKRYEDAWWFCHK